MPTLAQIVIHDQRTRRRGYQYQFTPKHHGGDVGAAQWLPSLRLEEEFTVFDTADEHELSDGDGRLYGVLRNAEGELRDLGTWQQQVAEFPPANEGVPWHGYPIWAVNDAAPANRSGEKVRPAKAVFARMEQTGLITARRRKRLYKGDHV
jgi:hypothetical protein